MTGLIKSSRILVPLLLAGLALATVLLLPVAAGASGMGVETIRTAADIPADSPPELGAQAVVLAGPDVQLSGSDANIPEVVANGTFVAVVHTQGGGVNRRVKLIASEGTNGWGYSVGVDKNNRQGNNPRLAFNPTTTNTVQIVWGGETERYIRHTACRLADPLPVCGEVSTIADAGTTDKLRLPDVAVDPEGRVHVVWYDANAVAVKTAYSSADAYRLDTTPVWTTTTLSLSGFDVDSVRQPVTAVAGNYVHVAVVGKTGTDWQTRYYRLGKSDHFDSTAPPSKVWRSATSDVQDMEKMNNPAIAASGNNVFLTWDNQYKLDGRYFGLVGSRSTDNGANWGTLKHITSTNLATSSPSPTNTKLSGSSDGSVEEGLRPSLAVTATNQFAIVWQQRPSEQCGFDIETGQTGNASSEIYFASFSEAWGELVGTLANISTTYSVDPDLARDSIGTHIVFMKAAASGCAPVGAYSVYYRGPVTEFSDKIGGGVYLPIIVKNY